MILVTVALFHNLSIIESIGQASLSSPPCKNHKLLLNLVMKGPLLERMMKKQIFCALALMLALVIPSIADTIRLKDGSVIRGQVVGFKDQQFTVLIGSGSQGRRSRTLIYVEDVESIEFDSDTPSGVSAPTVTEDRPQPESSPTPDYQPSRPAQPTRTNTNQPSTSTASTFFTIKVSVRADNTNNGWTNSGLVVRKGQRLKISSTGRVSLGGGRFSTPLGIPGVDNDKLMRTESTGALIAVIGDDNDDFLLIGTRRDFVAVRDGVLFLGVNEGNLNDNAGTYDVVIEAEAGGPPR